MSAAEKVSISKVDRDCRVLDLKPHPKNAEIYSTDVSDDFVENIRRVGIIDPLVVTANDVILSGHRRWLAAKKLGLDSIPVRVALVNDDLDEVDVLIACNDQRVKTFSEKAAEMAEMKKIEEERARRRRVEGKKLDLGENFPEGGIGRSSDIVGKKYGVSGKQVDKIVTIHEKAKDGDEQARGLMKELDAGKKSVNSAYQAIKNDGKPKTIAIVHVESNEQEQQAITVVAKEPQHAANNDEMKQLKKAIKAKDEEIENLREENRLLQEGVKKLMSGRGVEPKRKIGERTDAELLMKAQGDLTSLQNLYDGLIERYRKMEAEYRIKIEELEAALAGSLGEEKKGA